MRTRRHFFMISITVSLVLTLVFLRSRSSFLESKVPSSSSSSGWIREAKHKDKQPDYAEKAAQTVDDDAQAQPVNPTRGGVRWTSIHSIPSTETASIHNVSPKVPAPDRVIVIGRLQEEDTNWVAEELPDWQHVIYLVDDPSSAYPHTKLNKGREAMPYLTYLTENYHNLPSTIVFLHAHRASYPLAWHNEGGESYDAVDMLRALNIAYVQRNGYANLRCIHIPGCPDEIQPFRNPKEDHRVVEHAMADAWLQLFNNTNVPERIGTPCCAQFAVSREQVLKRPLEDYQRYMDWLVHTPLSDEVSGRVFEYLWHVFFGRDAVYCPTHEQCYCNVYGLCT